MRITGIARFSRVKFLILPRRLAGGKNITEESLCFSSYVGSYAKMSQPTVLGVGAPTTHHNHHDEVRKNGIRYALGLTRSIAYRRNCLVNRNPDIVVEMTLHVGIK